MSNLLQVAMIDTIRSLHQRGWSQRRIARELGLDRETVARYLHQYANPPKPAIAPTGSPEQEETPKPAHAPIGSTDPAASVTTGPARPARQAAGRLSDCAPWRAIIEGKLDLGLSAQRIYQDLTAEHGFSGSYYSVRRFVRHLEVTQELPFRRLECAPGEEAQVDFGTGAPLLPPGGKRRRTHVFRIVLSHSRKAPRVKHSSNSASESRAHSYSVTSWKYTG